LEQILTIAFIGIIVDIVGEGIRSDLVLRI